MFNFILQTGQYVLISRKMEIEILELRHPNYEDRRNKNIIIFWKNGKVEKPNGNY